MTAIHISHLPHSTTLSTQISDPTFVFRSAISDPELGLIFFSLSLDGKVEYLSPSADPLVGLTADRTQGRTWQSLLTNHNQNQKFWSVLSDLESVTTDGVFCEVKNEVDENVSLQVWRSVVFVQGAPAKLACIARRVQVDSAPLTDSYVTSVQPPFTPEEVLRRAALLSQGEREVIKMAVDGLMNKTMAKRLGVAVRTIEARRAKAMQKLGVRSLPELVRVWMMALHLENSQQSNED